MLQTFCFLLQAKELQTLYNLRRVFVEEIGARVKNVSPAQGSGGCQVEVGWSGTCQVKVR